MANNKENLIPQNKRSKEEQKAIAKKGGIASGKARREKKAMRETLEALLSMPLRNDKAVDIEKIKSLTALNGKNITVQEAIMLAQVQRAIKGDTKAATFLRDSAGENPATKLETNAPLDLKITIDYGGD